VERWKRWGGFVEKWGKWGFLGEKGRNGTVEKTEPGRNREKGSLAAMGILEESGKGGTLCPNPGGPGTVVTAGNLGGIGKGYCL